MSPGLSEVAVTTSVCVSPPPALMPESETVCPTASSFTAAGSISYFNSASLAIGDQVLAVDSASGQPTMVLTGWDADRLAKMTPSGHEARVHVTLTDDPPWAQAFVVIEALPLPSG